MKYKALTDMYNDPVLQKVMYAGLYKNLSRNMEYMQQSGYMDTFKWLQEEMGRILRTKPADYKTDFDIAPTIEVLYYSLMVEFALTPLNEKPVNVYMTLAEQERQKPGSVDLGTEFKANMEQFNMN